MEKAREFQKNIYFCFIDYAKAFDCVDHHKLWKILKAASRGAGKIPIFPSDGLELLLPGAQSLVHPLFIAFPHPGASSSPLPPDDQKALLILVSPVLQNCAGSAVHWTHC